MRKLRVLFVTAGGAMPALVATMVAATGEGCGSVEADDSCGDGGADGARVEPQPPPPSPSGLTPWCSMSIRVDHIVELPPLGVPAEPGQLCAVADASASSSVAARITLAGFSSRTGYAQGYIAVPESLKETIVAAPTISVVSATPAALSSAQFSDAEPFADGNYQFFGDLGEDVDWRQDGMKMVLKATFSIACEDGGTKTVESLTKMELCAGEGYEPEWVSSGDVCKVCEVIAEMAPSPIVSDNRGDDLPLGAVLRLRVVEVARAGRHVLLFAETDAGEGASYEWRVSEGALERVADDVMLWTLPEAANEVSRAPFGQVAVVNDAGAAVENFISGVTWEAA